ncbi:MAG: hypothetical protein F6K65_02320 [Moorea sp. SIO3C2]|nr:hypothetical protein [Moorena sp. SIO3C2]
MILQNFIKLYKRLQSIDVVAHGGDPQHSAASLQLKQWHVSKDSIFSECLIDNSKMSQFLSQFFVIDNSKMSQFFV